MELHKVTLIAAMACISLAFAFAVFLLVIITRVPGQQANGMGPKVCDSRECALAAAYVLQNIDPKLDPCNDFYRFSCQNFVKENQLLHPHVPTSLSRQADDRLKAYIRKILDTPMSDEDIQSTKMIKRFFKSCKTQDARNKFGLKFGHLIWEDYGGLPMVQGSSSCSQLSFGAIIGQIKLQYGINVLLNFDVLPDFLFDQSKPPQAYRMALEGCAPSLSKTLKTLFEGYSGLGGNKESNEAIAAEEFEKVLDAKYSNKSTCRIYQALRQVTKINDTSTEAFMEGLPLAPIEKLIETYPNLHLEDFFRTIFNTSHPGSVDDRMKIMVNYDPTSLEYIEELIVSSGSCGENSTTHTLVNYLYSIMLKELADIAPPNVTSKYQKSSKNWLNECTNFFIQFPGDGKLDISPLHWALMHEYIKAYVDEQDVLKMVAITDSLLTEFVEGADTLEWLDTLTKTKIKEKADAILVKAGFPEWVNSSIAVEEHYTEVDDLVGDSFMKNVISLKSWSFQKQLEKLNIQIDRSKFGDSLLRLGTGASYSANINCMILNLGLLQKPYFDSTWPMYMNYGALGSVIGHELTHGFDDSGRSYGPNGAKIPWFSEMSQKGYSNRAKCIEKMYFEFPASLAIDSEELSNGNLTEAAGKLKSNGTLTLNENIADNGGMNVAARAYHTYVKNHLSGEEEARLIGLQEYSNEQTLFLLYGQIWCQTSTLLEIIFRMALDEHSLNVFRVNGVLSNSEDFNQEFSCAAGTKMNREHKCKVW